MPIIEKLNISNKYRHHGRDSYWDGKRHKIALSLFGPFVILQLLFLGLMSYMYGTAYRSSERVHHMKVLAIDYDNGIIGQSLHAAYQQLESPEMLGFEWRSPEEFQEIDDLKEHVRSGKYWAGIYAFQGASQRLEAAVADNTTAQTYDPTQALGYVYNEARYPTAALSDVLANLEEVVAATRIAYNHINGTQAITSIPGDNTASIAAVLNPISATPYNIMPLGAGGKVFYNSVGQVFTILLQFFFLMAFNSITSSWQLHSRLQVWQNARLRAGFSLLYTLVGSLCVAAVIYAFRESTRWSGGQFVCLWMAFWLEMHVLFLVVEVMTTFLQMPWLPMLLVTFIILNVASCVMPFDLSPGFYRWGYALPCHEMYQLEINIMSGGANEHLAIALPVLFAWWVVFLPLAVFALYWRCSRAAAADEEIRAAIEEDRKILKQRSNDVESSAGEGNQVTDEEVERKREELLQAAARNEGDAARGMYGLGFQAPGPLAPDVSRAERGEARP
ncbi:hypothetical protein K431DRAFT_284414 [Polychaeton citri CBS 116435]|uniref:DUF3533 domain-containing protein n=1 Tax=Polychaeton citri CBS 116435 TaxID=1314669 RepID=A0A9P4QC56_9PEZI|nr:hypothetical protein K431DRAFT_284414 [Polychaeton citri CBS 116435]